MIDRYPAQEDASNAEEHDLDETAVFIEDI